MFSRRTLCSGEVVEKDHSQITQVSLRSDEAGCYHNSFLLAVVTDAGKRFGLTVTQYEFSEPQYRKDVCDRILCPMKSAIRRYCCERNDVLSSKNIRTALSERPVRGTIDIFSLYVLFSHFRPRDVLMGIFLLSFHKLCVHLHVHKTTLERNYSLE